MLTNHKKEGKKTLKTDSFEKAGLRENPESASMMDQQQHVRVERFLKLGYSHNDILRVLDSLHHDAQTNDILEELIKTCHTRPSSNKSLTNSPKLVPRGCNPSASQSRPGSERELASAFRPVVIDGSNVAMRWVHSLQLSVKTTYITRKTSLCIFISISSAGGHSERSHFTTVLYKNNNNNNK